MKISFLVLRKYLSNIVEKILFQFFTHTGEAKLGKFWSIFNVGKYGNIFILLTNIFYKISSKDIFYKICNRFTS